MKFFLLSLCLTIISAAGCASKEKQLREQVEQAASQLQHLSAYKEMQCQVRVQLSEPSKSAWLRQLSQNKTTDVAKSLNSAVAKKKLFTILEEQPFVWRATPYRCRLIGEQTQKLSSAQEMLLRDTEKKLELVMCVWMQSFYADSPLRGWKQGQAEIEQIGAREGVRLKKGQGRYLEVRDKGQMISAQLGDAGGQLSGQYYDIGGELYPRQIEQSVGSSLNRLHEINYQADLNRQVPSDFWLSLQQKSQAPPTAYLRAQFYNCTSR